jgi:hypothetical protein
MSNKIHRRVYISKKQDDELDSLRLVRSRTDEVVVQEEDDDTFFIQPNDSKGISMYDGCNHGDNFITLPLTTDLKAVRKERKDHIVNSYRCYTRENFVSDSHYRKVRTPTKIAPCHCNLCPQQIMEVTEVVAGKDRYHLPRVPLTHDVDGKFIWTPCCYVIILVAKADGASLDSDDDSLFLSAVIDIVMTEETDFELCLKFAAVTRELTGGTNISSLLQEHQWFAHQIVETFTIADICGGSYNGRVMSLINRLV